jgi:hypothetical protein
MARVTVGVARHSYAMTIVYSVATPATALIAVVSFLVGATAVGFVFLVWARFASGS